MVTRARVDSGQQGRGCGDVAAGTRGAVGGAQRGCGSARSWDPPPGQEPLGWPQSQRMRPKDVMLSRWPWGAQGTGRKHAGRPGGCGRVDHGPHSAPCSGGRGLSRSEAGREAGVQGPAPCSGNPLTPCGFVIPGRLSVTPMGSCTLGLLWSGASRSLDTRRPGGLSQPLLLQHSTAQHRVPASCLLSLQPWGAGLGPPPSSCGAFPRLKAPQPLTRGPQTLPVCAASPAQADHPGGRAAS